MTTGSSKPSAIMRSIAPRPSSSFERLSLESRFPFLRIPMFQQGSQVRRTFWSFLRQRIDVFRPSPGLGYFTPRICGTMAFPCHNEPRALRCSSSSQRRKGRGYPWQRSSQINRVTAQGQSAPQDINISLEQQDLSTLHTERVGVFYHIHGRFQQVPSSARGPPPFQLVSIVHFEGELV